MGLSIGIVFISQVFHILRHLLLVHLDCGPGNAVDPFDCLQSRQDLLLVAEYIGDIDVLIPV